MAPIVEAVEIARTPDDVFAYLSQLDRHHEWQSALLETELVTEGPTKLGSRARDTRKVPMGKQTFTYEVTAHDPPGHTEFKVLGGMIRPFGSVDIEPLDDGARSRVTLQLDFEGHGLLGKLLLPLVRRDAAKRVPVDQQQLKQRLESGA